MINQIKLSHQLFTYNADTTMKEQKFEYKYKDVLPTGQLGFLEYYMIPEKDELEYVYRPGDDSFLMLSVLKREIKNFPQQPVIVEIGSGSGILSAHLNHWLIQNKNPPVYHLSTDINMDACILSTKYYTHYELQIQQINASLLKNITFRNKAFLNSPVILLFNPPYVPTTQQQFDTERKYLINKIQKVSEGNIDRNSDSNMIAYSYMGGQDGLFITRKFIRELWELFVNRGYLCESQEICRAYLIVMGEQGAWEIKNIIDSYKSPSKVMKIEYIQKYNKMNQELYVVMISIKRI